MCLYEELHQYGFKEKFDCIVCNFSLIGKESTTNVIKKSADLLQENGRLIIQTLHPLIACGDFQYVGSVLSSGVFTAGPELVQLPI